LSFLCGHTPFVFSKQIAVSFINKGLVFHIISLFFGLLLISLHLLLPIMPLSVLFSYLLCHHYQWSLFFSYLLLLCLASLNLDKRFSFNHHQTYMSLSKLPH
jgi:hypothetical protein